MNRDIIPLLDNDVLSLIGKEVIKIRDRKTLEYWIEFYTPLRLRIVDRLYGKLNRKILRLTISNFHNYTVLTSDGMDYKEYEDIQKIKRLEHKFIINLNYYERWFENKKGLIEYETESEEDETESEEDERFRCAVREFYGDE